MSSGFRTRRRTRAAAGLSILMLAGWAPSLQAQWSAEAAAGGVSQESAGTAVSNTNALAGLRYEGNSWFYVSGGVPLASEGLPWAASGAGTRLGTRISRLLIGVDLDGHLHGYRASVTGETGGGAVAGVLPFVGVEVGPVHVEGRSGLAHYSSSFAGETISRTAHDSGLSAEFRPSPRLVISGEGRLLRAEEGDYRYIGGAAELATGPAGLWASLGTWTSDLLPDLSWGAGAVVRLLGPLSLRASYQQEPTDPLFWNQTRRFWSVGLSRQIGRPPVPPIAAPLVPEMVPGGVVFRIPAAGYDAAPAVAGDFNGWVPVAMVRFGDEWVATIPVPPGIHHYAFQAADGTWFVPESVENRVDDGFGGTNAVLVVPRPTSR